MYNQYKSHSLTVDAEICEVKGGIVMSIRRRFFCVFLCMSLLICLIPASESKADPEPDYYAESIEVTVHAYDIEKEEDVPVEGAVVTLSRQGSVLRKTESGPDGKAILSLEGLTSDELSGATVEAYKITDRGKAISGPKRDALFEYYPKDENGEYYRYEYQLHSETIDPNGNWNGHLLPFSLSRNADIVFIIDGTGSMEDILPFVKTNLESYIQKLKDLNFNIRYSVIEYRDVYYDQLPVVHEQNGSHWFTDEKTVINIINGIEADGGGDTLFESLKDTVDCDLLGDEMDFRSDAFHLAYIVTDADTQLETRYGSSVWFDSLNRELKEKNIALSIVSTPYLGDEYLQMYENTGGECFDYNSTELSDELYDHTARILKEKTPKLDLELSEPRLLLNMSLSYLADDDISRSESYRNSMIRVLKEYSKIMAQTTDGHVFLNNVILLSADSFMDFNTSTELAAMADIQIHTKEHEDGVTIHSNGTVNGFYSAATRDSSANTSKFEFEKNKEQDLSSFNGRKSFRRIQLSGMEGAGWGNSFIKDPVLYASTMMHESGHYIFGFFDEYLDENEKDWRFLDDKPYPHFGLMDDQHTDIELSKQSLEYRYLSEFYGESPILSKHYDFYGASCEKVLADLLVKGMTYPDMDKIASTSYITHSKPVFNSPYRANYTYAPYGGDRTAGYAEAVLDDDDFILLDDEENTSSGSDDASGTGLPFDAGASDEAGTDREIMESAVSLGRFFPASGTGTFTVETDGEEGADYTVYLRRQGEKEFSAIELVRGEDGQMSADLPIDDGDLAQVFLVKEADGTIEYNTLFIDRPEPSKGYIYASPDGCVEAYGVSEEETSFTFIADKSSYENGEYFSLNQATWVSAGGAAITDGEICSAASSVADLDFSSVSWFRYDGENWIPIPTECDTDENVSIVSSAKLDGEGLYVLMGKKAAESTAQAPDCLAFEASEAHDGEITLSFDDLNENTRFYYVYYTDDPDADPVKDEMLKMVIEARSCGQPSDTGRSFLLNLGDRGKVFNVAVVSVLEDGSRSPAAKIQVTAPEADRDGDGIPDWYLDQYRLWLDDPEAIAGADPDGDGLTNLEEFLSGTDPTVPDVREPEEEQPEDIIRRQEEMIRSLQAEMDEYMNTIIRQSEIIEKQQGVISDLQEQLDAFETTSDESQE